jgi:hypothetical protein
MQSFVARIWIERVEGQQPTWRGHVQHIQGSEEAYFQDLAQMSEFLERVSGIPGPEMWASRSVAASRRRRAAPAGGARPPKK